MRTNENPRQARETNLMTKNVLKLYESTAEKFLETSVFEFLKSLVIIFHLTMAFNAHHSTLLFPQYADFQIPFPGLEFLANPWFVFFLAWGTLISGLMALFRIGGKWSLLASGILGFIFILMSVNTRLAFGYFSVFSMLAIFLSDWKNDRRYMILLLVFVYLSAGLHKLINFESMLSYLPPSVFNLVSPNLKIAFPLEMGILTKWLSYLVIPVELSMGSLFIFRKTRGYAFILCAAFHSLNSIFLDADGIDSVSLRLLTLHACIAIFDKRINWKNLLSQKYFRLWWMSFFIVAGIHFLLPVQNLLREVLPVYFAFGPLIFMCCFGYYLKEGKAFNSPWSVQIFILPAAYSFSIWAGCLLMWSITPVLNHYRNLHYGWAMFTGAHLDQPDYCLLAPRKPCYLNTQLKPVIELTPDQAYYIYTSKQPSSLLLFESYLKDKCLNTNFPNLDQVIPIPCK
jgi:hypothetical protein